MVSELKKEEMGMKKQQHYFDFLPFFSILRGICKEPVTVLRKRDAAAVVVVHGVPVCLLGGGLVRRADEAPVEGGELRTAEGPVPVDVVGHEGGDGSVEVGEHLVVEGDLLELPLGGPPRLERLVGDLAGALLVDHLDRDAGLLGRHVVPHLAAHVRELGGVDGAGLVKVVLVEEDLGERDAVVDGLAHAQGRLLLVGGVVCGAEELAIVNVGALLGEPAVAHAAHHAFHVVEDVVVLDGLGRVGDFFADGAGRRHMFVCEVWVFLYGRF